MGDSTLIGWTDATWNPWQGCHKVSPGCANCYMFRDKARYGQDAGKVVRSSKATFNRPLHWHNPQKVFVCSWSDFFVEEADRWRDEAWEIIRKCSHLTFQILTKRPENIADRLPADWGIGWPNVWIGVSAENQAMADRRIPILMTVPAVVRFVSCEPLLGPIDIWAPIVRFEADGGEVGGWTRDNPFYLHWVIVGGESGPNYRPMDWNWARGIRDQCQGAGVAFFYKQISGITPGLNPKLDGVEYHEFPEVRNA